MERMISFMAIDRLEGNCVVCEVEKVPIDGVNPSNSFNVDCFMVDVDMDMFLNKCLPVYEGNVYSVAHIGNEVVEVLKLEEEERQRRLAILRNLGL